MFENIFQNYNGLILKESHRGLRIQHKLQTILRYPLRETLVKKTNDSSTGNKMLRTRYLTTLETS